MRVKTPVTRREFLRKALIGAAGVSTSVSSLSMIQAKDVTSPVHPPGKPNILLITSEDNGPQLSCYGDRYVKTPRLDKLAAEGIRFTNAYVTQAGCSPSRSSIFTGVHPHQNGQIGLATHFLRMYREDIPNIFRSFKSAGYRTGVIGKIHVNPESAFPLDYHEKLGGFSGRDIKKEAQEAETFIKQANKPFMLMVNYKDAHSPFIKQYNGLPARPLEPEAVEPLPQIGLDSPLLREDTANYYNCMMRLDKGIGMLMDTLDRCGKRANTLVVYLGDHGADVSRGKRTCYEGGLKIPLIIRWPAQVRPGQVRDELVSTIDFFPTFLAAAGIRPPVELPGRPLQPLFNGRPKEWRQYLFAEYHLHSGHNFYPRRCVRDSRYKLILNLSAGEVNPGYEFTIGKKSTPDIEQALNKAPANIRRAYEINRVSPKYELYDLKNDPYEFNNLADRPEHKEVLEELKEVLQQWRIKTRDPLLNPKNLKRLKDEVYSRWKTDDFQSYKKRDGWEYPDYFFE